MEMKPKTGRPSFFKVLMEDYTSRLRLPHAFVHKYGEFLPESAKLRSSSGETWDVKLDEETYDDEKYLCLIGGGWTKFVKDLELKLGEFLVFWFNLGNSITFDVLVYGTNCCEREISAMAVDSDADHQDSEFSNDCYNVPASGNLIMKKEPDNISSSKRGRGRPPKSSIVSTKRGRGRPPKSITVPMKRGRGRPPKSLAIC